jgi:general secretion pathway protein A
VVSALLRKLIFIGMVLVFAAVSTAQTFTVEEKDLERQANLIAKLLVSCRAIIAQNQDLINDPEKGDKGFTGDVYTSNIKAHFKNATDVDVSENDAFSADPVKKSLGVLLCSAKAVIDESQKVINMKGKGFKKIIPAVVGRRTSFKYNKAMGVGYYLKQTSIRYRNPANHPDVFEAKYLNKFEGPGYPKDKGMGEIITNSDGSRVYRYMLPISIKPSCLKCHGGPEGEMDISGGIKEGYKEGEIRGAISVMVPYYSFRNLTSD